MHKCTEMYSKRPEYTGECQSCLFEITFQGSFIIRAWVEKMEVVGHSVFCVCDQVR